MLRLGEPHADYYRDVETLATTLNYKIDISSVSSRDQKKFCANFYFVKFYLWPRKQTKVIYRAFLWGSWLSRVLGVGVESNKS